MTTFAPAKNVLWKWCDQCALKMAADAPHKKSHYVVAWTAKNQKSVENFEVG